MLVIQKCKADNYFPVKVKNINLLLKKKWNDKVQHKSQNAKIRGKTTVNTKRMHKNKIVQFVPETYALTPATTPVKVYPAFTQH